MKPLTVEQKKFLYRKLVLGRYARVFEWLYDALVYVLLTWHRFEDIFYPRAHNSDLRDLTAIIKTFERPNIAKRLIKSIRRRYPVDTGLKIILVDDGQQPQDIPAEYAVDYITMPYDSGLSAGRNRALDEVQTPFFLLLDDDFVFSHRQKLGELLDLMRRYEQIDIVGGRYIDLPLYITHQFQEQPISPTNVEPKTPLGTTFDQHRVVNKVQNYFIGRTATVRQVKWPKESKMGEHTEFFTRACGKLTTVYHKGMLILHVRTPFNLDYAFKRWR